MKLQNFIITMVLLLLSFRVYAAPKEFVLMTGQNLKLKTNPSAQVFVSNGRLVKLIDNNYSLEVLAKKTGSTDLKLGTKNYSLHILNESDFNFYHQAKKSVHNFLDLDLAIASGEIYLSGQLHRFSDWKKISHLQNPNYIFNAKIDEDLHIEIKKHLSKLFLDIGIHYFKLSLNRPYKIIINENSKAKEKQILKISRAFGLEIHFDKNILDIKPIAKVQILIAEVNKKFRRKLGVNFDSSYQAQLLPDIANNSSLNIFAHAIEENGIGHVLAKPELLCKSGEKAEFFAGGEFPIKVVGYKSEGVVWRKHGIILNFEPTIDPLGQIDLKIKTEVSIIDKAQTVNDIPGIKINKITTHFNLTKPRMILISGLIKEDWGTNTEGLPFLSQIPILGRLFSSKDYKKNKTELLVFVRPEIIFANGKNSTTKEATKSKRKLMGEQNETFK